MTALGLYIHVPFCRKKCDWCAFFSRETCSEGPWLQRILNSLDPSSLGEDVVFQTVYWGGGTPSLLSASALESVLDAISPSLSTTAELTFEANPESLNPDHLETLSRTSFARKRLSLGIQTFHETILASHGRPTRKDHLTRARSLCRDWSGEVSLDLICGLAGQTTESQWQDLDEALSWEPHHISWYSLTVEPETRLGRRVQSGLVKLPAEDLAAQWWIDGADYLENHGLSRYEISNFAAPGFESEHNTRYWTMKPWWGLGPSAVSLLPDGNGRYEYRTEPPDWEHWLRGDAPDVERPTRLEFAKDELMVGLRLRNGVPANVWAQRLARTIAECSSMVKIQDGRLFLMPQAFPFLDSFLRRAFSELDDWPEFQ